MRGDANESAACKPGTTANLLLSAVSHHDHVCIKLCRLQKSISGIYDKVTQNNRLVVKNIIQAFDSSFTTVNNLIFTIHGLPFDPVKSGDGGRMDMAQVYNLQDNLASLISSVDYIEDVIVFTTTRIWPLRLMERAT